MGTLTVRRLKEFLRYDPDAGSFVCIKARRKVQARPGDIVGCIQKNGYNVVAFDGARYLAHRLAWFYVTGRWPSHQIDHINMDRADNRWINLREATKSQNMMNASKRADNTSGHKGVSWSKGSRKWLVHISSNGKCNHVGFYDELEEAIAAHADAASRYHGEFARIE